MTSVEIPLSIAAALPNLTVLDITNDVQREVAAGGGSGIAFVSPNGDPSLIRVQERETGFFADLECLLERLVPLEAGERERLRPAAARPTDGADPLHRRPPAPGAVPAHLPRRLRRPVHRRVDGHRRRRLTARRSDPAFRAGTRDRRRPARLSGDRRLPAAGLMRVGRLASSPPREGALADRPDSRLRPGGRCPRAAYDLTWLAAAHTCGGMERARRHQRALARLALIFLALFAELFGRSLSHRLDFGQHVRTPSYSGADYYPILLAVVKFGVALMLARLAWRFVKAIAALICRLRPARAAARRSASSCRRVSGSARSSRRR